MMRKWKRIVFGIYAATVLASLLSGCASSPGSALARASENGRLLQDGPQALMTSTTIAVERQNDVPILYEFAIEAGAIGPKLSNDGRLMGSFPTTDVGAQQAALSTVGRSGWADITRIGEGRIDRHCTQFISALYTLEKEKKATLANINAIQSATVGIMGLAVAAQKAIGITGVAFGLAGTLFDNTTSSVLYQLPAQSITSIVLAQRDILRNNEKKILSEVTNQGLASARLAEYTRYCIPVTIEANIATVLGIAKAGPDNTIQSAGAPAAVSSSGEVKTISAITNDPANLKISAQPLTPRATIRRRLSSDEITEVNALRGQIDTIIDRSKLETLGKKIGIPITDASLRGLDAAGLKKIIKGTVYAKVESANDRLDEVAKLKTLIESVLY